MRIVAILLLVVVGIGCAPTRSTNATTYVLNGRWVPVKQEMGGTSLPAAAFGSQVLVMSDSTYSFTAESIDKGVLKYGHDTMDIYGKEGVNAGKHFTALYKFENGQLTICYNLAGDHYPESLETKGKPKYFLSIFKKELTK
jgi:uncharacterized protein (TIGR03067 family)